MIITATNSIDFNDHSYGLNKLTLNVFLFSFNQ